MTTISTPKGSGGELSPTTLAIALVAGVLAVPVFHQILFLVFYLVGVIPVAPFSMKPTAPFGVPEVISSSFWGGVWGIVFVLLLPRFFCGTSYWLVSAITGGVVLTLVYMFVVVPLKTGAMLPDMVGLFIVGFLLNAAWGIGWALFLRLFERMRDRATEA
jgi:hypothetical protein